VVHLLQECAQTITPFHCCNTALIIPSVQLLQQCSSYARGPFVTRMCSNNDLGPHFCKQDNGTTGVSNPGGQGPEEEPHATRAGFRAPEQESWEKARYVKPQGCHPMHTSHLIYLGCISVSSQAPSDPSLQIFELEF
jgi:hypothetical protein